MRVGDGRHASGTHVRSSVARPGETKMSQKGSGTVKVDAVGTAHDPTGRDKTLDGAAKQLYISQSRSFRGKWPPFPNPGPSVTLWEFVESEFVSGGGRFFAGRVRDTSKSLTMHFAGWRCVESGERGARLKKKGSRALSCCVIFLGTNSRDSQELFKFDFCFQLSALSCEVP